MNENGGAAAAPATAGLSAAINGPLVLAVLLFMAAALALLMFGAIGEQISPSGGRIAFYASLFVAFVAAATCAHRVVVSATLAPAAAVTLTRQSPAPLSDVTSIVIGDAERQVAHGATSVLTSPPPPPSTAASLAVSSSVLSSPLPVSPAPPPPAPVLLPLPSPGLTSLNRISLGRKPKPDSSTSR